MGYEKIDENATYRTACENVKKIANAIKEIKLKYYPNPDRISSGDKTKLDTLFSKLETISTENGLSTLKEVLMADLNERYTPRSDEDNKGTQSWDNLLKACYGAIDAETTALSYGRIKQAQMCQSEFHKYLEMIKSQKYLDSTKLQNLELLIIEYRRGKFGELAIGRANAENKTTEWLGILKDCYKPEDLLARKGISEAIKAGMNRDTGKQIPEQEEEMIH